MKYITTRMRLTFGLVCILVTILLVAMWLRILPDRSGEVLEGRAALCEAVAVNASALITRQDLNRFRAILITIVRRKDNVLSAAIRRVDGELLCEVGDHRSQWEPVSGDRSTESQVQVPIRAGDQRWGTVEMRFTPLNPPGLLGIFQDPQMRMIAFVAASAFVWMFLFLSRMLKHLDPSKAVPGHVRSVFDTFVEAVLVLDTRQRIVMANKAFSSLSGKSPDRLLGVQASELPWRGDDDHEPVESFPWEQVVRDSTAPANSILRLQSADGTLRTFMVNCSPVPARGGPVRGVLVSLDDVTKLQQQEIELRKSKREAEAANRAKSEFLANMSHEIRTPMNAILGFADVLRRGMAENAQQRGEYLDTIHSSGTFLLELINDILDLSKIEAGRLDVEKTSCSPHAVVAEVVEVLRVRARERGLTLDYTTAGPIPETIESDPTRLRQILTNLVGNALKFTQQGGVKVVVRLQQDQRSPKLAIDVLDTGVGIASDTLDSIFDPFTQADSSITRRFGGTGLGLAISQRFAEALGGELTAVSTLGQGSTFTVTVDPGPLAGVELLDFAQLQQRVKQAPRPDQPIPRSLPASRILVVDDGEANRQLIRVVLERAGATVATATNGQEAVDLVVDGDPFDVILMDMQMPVMDGYTAATRLREMGVQQPIIALTANVMAGDEEKCRAAGCSGFLPKPIDLDNLIRTVAAELPPVATVSAVADPPASAPGDSSLVATGGPPVPAPAGPSPSAAVAPPSVATGGSPVPAPAGLTASAVAGPPPAPHPMSPSQRQEFGLPGDDAEFEQVMATFFASLSADLSGIRHAWQAKDFDALGQRAHSIKGTAGTFGYPELSRAAARAEQLVQRQSYDELEAALDALEALVEWVMGPQHEPAPGPVATGGPPVPAPTGPTHTAPPPAPAQRPMSPPPRQEPGLPVTDATGNDATGNDATGKSAHPTECAPDAATPKALRAEPGGRPPVRSTLPVEDPVFRQIVVDFVQRLDEQLVVMEAACREGDYEQLASLAHWLKGAGGTVGFAEFTAPARTLEQYARQSETDNIATILTELKDIAQALEVPPAAEVAH